MAAPHDAQIAFEDVEVRFGDVTALPGFSLEIRQGEFFTLLGPSGCGKTTALRSLAGLVDPTRGRLRIAGRDVTRLRSDQRGLGMVFQNYALFPSMSVGENIAFGLKAARRASGDVRAAVREVAGVVELTEDQLGRSVTELSGGQQQRVAIARSLVMRPEILLLDEPLSNLDAQLRRQLRGQLKSLQRQVGITTIYVTHDQEEALSMSDRIAVMRGGRIEQVGTPQEVYDHSATEFVCTFIGDANRLDPRLAARIAPGDRESTAYTRTEKVSLRRPAGGLAPGAVAGRIRERSYHGTSSTYEVDCGEYGAIRAVVLEAGDADLAVGEEVGVTLAAEHVLRYPLSAAEPVAAEGVPS